MNFIIIYEVAKADKVFSTALLRKLSKRICKRLFEERVSILIYEYQKLNFSIEAVAALALF